MTNPRPKRRAIPPKRPPEVIRQTQGQRRLELADAVEETEPVSQVRPAWPGKGAIEQIFRDAQRLKA